MTSHLATSLRTHLAGAAMLVPEPDALLWSWFVALTQTRTYHTAGPNPIGYAEIEAFARLYRWPLEPRHIEAIRELDDVWLSHVRAVTAGSPTAGSSRRASSNGQTINPAAFDAVFG